MPAEVADIAYQNKSAIYGLLFQAASETMVTIAADPKHLGARVGMTAVLHTWGSAMTHLPHIHMIVRFKDYRRTGTDRQQIMTLAADEFIRRFLLHVLPKGFHRVRHYGLLAGAARKVHLNHIRELLGTAPRDVDDATVEPDDIGAPCPCCGGRMVIIETFERWSRPRWQTPS